MVCPICNSANVRPIKTYAAKNSFFVDAKICQCGVCGMQMTLPLPSEAAWRTYNKSYFMNAHGGLNSSKWIDAYNIGVAKTRLNAFIKYLDEQNVEVNSVLEIGPGQGYFMREFRKQRPNLDYYVVESDASVHGDLKRHGAALVDADEIQRVKSVDAVIATHVLEHTLDPIGFLQHFTTSLRPGGVVFIETPCLDHEYKDVHEPHILFFEKSTLKKCFELCDLQHITLTYNGDAIRNLRRNGFVRKCLVKLEVKTGVPFHILLGQYWANDQRLGLTYQQSLAIVETSPHIEQDLPARWVRAFGKSKNV